MPDPVLFSQLAKRSLPQGFFWLVYLEHHAAGDKDDREAYRLTSRDRVVSYSPDGTAPVTWSPAGFRVEDIRSAGDGSLNGLTVTFPNIRGRLLKTAIDREFRGQPAALYLMNEILLASPGSIPRWDAKITDVSVTETTATVTLSDEPLYGETVPRSIIAQPGCGHTYGQGGCAFPIAQLDPGQASLGPCGGTIEECRLRGDLAEAAGVPNRWPKNIKGFPGAKSGA